MVSIAQVFKGDSETEISQKLFEMTISQSLNIGYVKIAEDILADILLYC